MGRDSDVGDGAQGAHHRDDDKSEGEGAHHQLEGAMDERGAAEAGQDEDGRGCRANPRLEIQATGGAREDLEAESRLSLALVDSSPNTFDASTTTPITAYSAPLSCCHECDIIPLGGSRTCFLLFRNL